ncbi:hypothetical protein FHS19_005001 [Paenibacillus rhizosphaerae]|uniref:Uncharacterized protein n=1 Tax=Paenibacillus rhizosphaerae TaxID=297318 RepID=A0A839TTZ0_9BACL|nr:transposase [Paenibacillus rhizosphaerae]MBB3130296.1 hypothetical protein [Paenibacillus rhizosphaerae]
MSNEDKRMLPISHDKVEVDGVYTNEAGREELLHRGDEFPADLILGSTEWKLTEFTFDNHHEGRTDPRLVPKENDTNKREKIVGPRRQFGQGGHGGQA